MAAGASRCRCGLVGVRKKIASGWGAAIVNKAVSDIGNGGDGDGDGDRKGDGKGAGIDSGGRE